MILIVHMLIRFCIEDIFGVRHNVISFREQVS